MEKPAAASLDDDDPESIGAVRVQVGDVRVRGNQKTLTAFIVNELNLRGAQTLDDLVEACDHAYWDLKEFGIFDRVDVALRKGSSPGTCDIDVAVLEKQPIQVSAGTELDSHDTALKLDVLYRNVFGQAELAKLSATFATSKSGGFDVSFKKPRLWGGRASLDSSVFVNEINRSAHSSYVMDTQGVSVSILSPGGSTSVGYTCAKRDIMTAANSSRSIARDAQTSVKSAVTATYRADSRDSPLLPTRGSLFGAGGEVGLPFGGDATFIKLSGDLQHYVALGRHVSLGLSLKTGVLLPYPPARTKRLASTPLPDRFTYGGPLLLRGYQYDSIGPHDGADMLGGDALAAAGASLTCGVPGTVLERLGVRLQAFVNSGSLISLTHGGSTKYHLDKLRTGARHTAGIGFVIPTAIGRVEANYCWHPNRRPNDRTQSFQLGISSSFL